MSMMHPPQLPSGWTLWRRQLLALIGSELRRSLRGGSGLILIFLAFAPAAVTILHSSFARSAPGADSVEHDTALLAWLFQLFYVRLGCFFGVLGIFVRMFRGEFADRTAHYLFLLPMRRELLVTGKYVSGSVGAAAVFALGGCTCFLGAYAHHGFNAELAFLRAQGLHALLAYVGITTLACIGYASVFVALSLVFRNPVLPAVVYLGWESISGMLPAFLQPSCVTYYLKPLFPVSVPVVGFSGLFTVVVEPVAPVVAVFGLLLFSAVVVTAAAIRFRRAEIEGT
jgi:ABC-type transport system involved in multi-copper enzyme maturation permease subunit